MSKFIYTNHAKIRFDQRKLSENIVEDAILHPDRILPGMINKTLAQKNINGKTLEVVFVKENDKFVIITAYYLEEEN